MNWYEYIACFFAGMFLANVVPHFVHGISGDRFPTPFAHPHGKGLSSPMVNVVWALFNLVVGYILFRVGKVSTGDGLALLILFRFSWKWRGRSTVKITERTHEEATEALHTGRESRHPAAAFARRGADLEALR